MRQFKKEKKELNKQVENQFLFYVSRTWQIVLIHIEHLLLFNCNKKIKKEKEKNKFSSTLSKFMN